jgi:hypothetical protein
MDKNEIKLFEELSNVEKALLREIDTIYADTESKINAYLEEIKNKNE